MELKEFINEKLLDTTRTLIQEVLTCVFFDAYFNLGEKFKTTDDIVAYYTNNEKLITNVAMMIGLSKAEFDEFLIQTNSKGKYDKICLEWQKSFLFQCESFEKWVKKHPSFSKNLVFVHHDTSIGVHKGNINGGWSITKRVDVGKSKFGFSDKDEYQKADIYAIVNDVNMTPEEDISNEVTYWIQSIEGKESDTFVGISLKKLKKPLTNVHTYGLDQDVLVVKEGSVECRFPLFDGVKYAKNDFKAGTTTSEIRFVMEFGDGEHDAIFAIRSNGKDASKHAHVDPKASFGVPTTTELKIKNAGAQAGKCQSLISSWFVTNSKDYNIAAYDGMLSNINTAFPNIPSSLPNDAKLLLDYLYVNHDSILNIYKMYEKNGGIDAVSSNLEELGFAPTEKTIDMLYDATKWEVALFKILQSLEAISVRAKKSSVENVLEEMVKYAKGIGDEDDLRLPYVLVGESKQIIPLVDYIKIK